MVSDKIPGQGALGGLYTALGAVPEGENHYAAVVACDMPFANPALLKYEYELLLNKGNDGVVPRSEGMVEPFHSVYRCSTCLPPIEAAIQSGKWRADAWYREVSIYFLSPQEIQPYDPMGLAFLNVNTPEELAAAENIAQK